MKNIHKAAARKEQVPTHPVTTQEIMGTAAFEQGPKDVRKGVPFDWRINDWEYERGRLFGHIAPTTMPCVLAAN